MVALFVSSKNINIVHNDDDADESVSSERLIVKAKEGARY